MTSKGQVTIPKRLRDRIGLKPGSVVEFQHAGEGQITLKSAAADAARAERERERLEKALAALGEAKFDMTTDEVMRLTRGWGEPDYDMK